MKFFLALMLFADTSDQRAVTIKDPVVSITRKEVVGNDVVSVTNKINTFLKHYKRRYGLNLEPMMKQDFSANGISDYNVDVRFLESDPRWTPKTVLVISYDKPSKGLVFALK
jgi:hypothetical protein